MKKSKTILIWTIAVVLTLVTSYYQRRTGPSYPLDCQFVHNNKTINYQLPRTHGGEGGEWVKLVVPDNSIIGKMKYKRFKSNDLWTTVEMQRSGDTLMAEIPHQPMAGKVEYLITFETEPNVEVPLNEQAAIIRFRGDVPIVYLIIHIVIIFFAMCLSMRTGLEAIFKRSNLYKLTLWTIISLAFGGIIFGPIVQYYAFGAFWTGWPFGTDLTDNKTAVAILFWIIALWRVRKNPASRGWVIAAAIILIAVYLIPHSVLGSEIDYTK
jgi:hypothetical protein